ncbi:hypothetical protein [Cryobacterium tagatosivorans]|uniref:Uncharacterized protein n=1 Tax=Cryobacterium tagatosivorans TaxID=1259199 RepID=A0A4R8UHJ5_9MICO|nr:hypothetical protein [Cryobacterium tagatosivorans]TFB53067.1 hypothetical protein E3O23_05675 [Cryobacterium tagatosivorans]
MVAPLDVTFKHEILADLDAPLSPAALEEVFRLSGKASPDLAGSVRLTAAEQSYIRTQVEAVD